MAYVSKRSGFESIGSGLDWSKARAVLSELLGVDINSISSWGMAAQLTPSRIDSKISYRANVAKYIFQKSVERGVDYVSRSSTGNKRIKRDSSAEKPNDDFYHSQKWRDIRYQVLSESDGKCSLCGRTAKDGVQIHVDHIIPRSERPDLSLKKSNLQIMCRDCNMGKLNKDDTDWR